MAMRGWSVSTRPFACRPTSSIATRSKASGSSPFIFGPAHYLKQFHQKYVDPETLEKRVKESRMRNWIQLHVRMDEQYRFDNPELPTLQPWIPVTRPPSDRFVFKRNPYFHRMDENG